MKSISALLLFAILLSACSFQPTPAPKVLGAELDALVQEKHEAGLYDGAVLIARDGQVLLSQGYGFADREM